MAKKPSNPRRSALLFETLEPRLLLSAEGFGAIVADSGLDDDQALPQTGAEIAILQVDETEQVQIAAVSQTQELVFIDSDTPDHEQLVDDLLEQAGSGRQIEVIVLDAERDGVAQISEALADRQDISAMHIIAHGEAGSLQLGDARLEFDTLVSNASAIQRWGDALDADADILIYGCDLASDAAGQGLVDALARLTGADVTASDDPTGDAALGGDWDLEYQTGQVETGIVLSDALRERWLHTLRLFDAGGNALVNSPNGVPEANADVGVFTDGSYVVVWNSTQAGDEDVYARLFNADGTEKVAEFRVNGTTTNEQKEASVAVSDNGNFVVTWMSTQGTNGQDIYTRVFDSNGTALVGETGVMTAVGDQYNPDVAIDASGNFVVVWEDGADIYAQRYDAVATPNVEGVLLVNAPNATIDRTPAVAMDTDGDFVVAWTDESGGPSILMQRFNNLGAGQGVVSVQASSGGAADTASVAMDDAGNFVVAWNEFEAALDNSQSGIQYRRFAFDGTPLDASDQLANTYITLDQLTPSVAMDNDGDFIITWTSVDQDGDSKGVYGQAFNADGSTDGSEFQVNTYTTSDQNLSQVAISDSGSAVIVWEGQSATDTLGVYAQRYRWPIVADNFDDGAAGSTGYTGNDGSQNWAADWIETNEPSDRLRVVDKNGGGDWRLVVEADTAFEDYWVSRQVDLTGSTTATLTYDFELVNNFSAYFDVAVRDGDTGWTTLQGYNPNGGSSGSQSIPIAANLRDNGLTEIRFRSRDFSAAGELFYIDNVHINHDGTVSNTAPSGAGGRIQ